MSNVTPVYGTINEKWLSIATSTIGTELLRDILLFVFCISNEERQKHFVRHSYGYMTINCNVNVVYKNVYSETMVEPSFRTRVVSYETLFPNVNVNSIRPSYNWAGITPRSD